MNRIIQAISAFVLAISSSAAMADVAIISHPDTKVGDIDAGSIRNVFLGERKSFPNGIYAYPINHKQGSPDRETFFSSVLSMSEKAHDRHWKRKQATTTGYRPLEVSSYEDLLESVASTPGSVGYIDAGMVDDSVRVLMTIQTDDKVYDGNVYATKAPGIAVPE